MRQTDTIAAIATAPGVGGVGIIRISGDLALSICQKLFYLPNTDRFEYGIWSSFLDSFRPQQCHTMRMN